MSTDTCTMNSEGHAVNSSGHEYPPTALAATGNQRLPLEAAAAAAQHRPDVAHLGDGTPNGVVGTLAHVGRGAVFWASLAVAAGPGLIGRQFGVTPEYKHWNWITHNLILGAMPVMTAVAGRGNHLHKMEDQLRRRGRRIGLVVSCLTTREIEGFGVGVCTFAKPGDWRSICGVENFEQLSIEDHGADVDPARVQQACDHMLRVVRNDEAVYVHCKGGKGRSWMVLMCYLCSYAGMTFDDAAALVRGERYQVSPSAPQIQFVHDFVARYGQRSVHPEQRLPSAAVCEGS